jgi:hypothetical protein
VSKEQVREVRVKWVSDEDSLKKLNDQIDQLEQRMGSIGGGGFSGGIASGKSLPGALPQMHGSSGGVSSLPSTIDELSAGMGGGPSIGGGDGGNASVMHIAYAHTVQIMAQSVTLSGGGVGGGSGIGTGGGQIAGDLLSLPGMPETMNSRASSVLGMRTGPMGAVMGNIVDTLMPIAPYAIGGMAVQAGMSYGYDVFSTSAEQRRADELASLRSGLGMGQSSAMTALQRTQRSAQPLQNLYKNPLFNIATLGMTGFIADQQSADIEQLLQQQQLTELGLAQTITSGPFDKNVLTGVFHEPGMKPHPGVTPGSSSAPRPGYDQDLRAYNESVDIYEANIAGAIRFGQAFSGYGGLQNESFYRRAGLYMDAGGEEAVDALISRTGRMVSRAGTSPGKLRALLGGNLTERSLDALALESVMAEVIGGNISAGQSLVSEMSDYGSTGVGKRNLQSAMISSSERNLFFRQQAALGNQGVIRAQQSSIEMAIESQFGSAAGMASHLGSSQSSISQQQSAIRSQNNGIRSQIAEMKRLPMNPDRRVAILELENRLESNMAGVSSLGLEQMTLERGVQMAQVSEEMSGISLAGSKIERRVGMAGLTGSATDSANAQREYLSITDQIIDVQMRRLEKEKLSETEQNEILANIQGLRASREQSEIQIARGEFRGNLALSQTRRSTATIQAGMLEGVEGSAAAARGMAGIVGMGGSEIANMKAELSVERSRSSPDSRVIADLEREIAGAEAAQLSMFGGSYRASYELRGASRNLNAYMTILGSTATVPGNMRAGAEAQLGIAQAKLQEIEKIYKSQMESASTDAQRKTAQETYEINKNEVMLSEALPAQQMLESGQLDRLVSQVYGAGGNFDMVASQFTAREATLFGGMVGRSFGGTEAQMKKYRKSGPLFFNTLAGATQTQEGFLETVAAGKEVAIDGEITVHVIMEDMRGNVIDEQRHQLQSGSQLQASLKSKPKNYQSG